MAGHINYFETHGCFSFEGFDDEVYRDIYLASAVR